MRHTTEVIAEPETGAKRGFVSRVARRPWGGKAEVNLTEDVDTVVVRHSPRFDAARERIAPRLESAKTRVVPAAEVAAERARQVVLEDVIPQVTAAMTAAASASEPYRREAQRRGKAAAAALRGAELEVEPEKKTHRIRNLLVALGLGGVAAAVYKWMSGNDDADAWQQAYEPAPAEPYGSPVTAVPPEAHAAPAMSSDPGDPLGEAPADPGAAGPDEALADLTDEPHQPTSPDSPLEESELPPPPDGTSR